MLAARTTISRKFNASQDQPDQ